MTLIFSLHSLSSLSRSQLSLSLNSPSSSLSPPISLLYSQISRRSPSSSSSVKKQIQNPTNLTDDDDDDDGGGIVLYCRSLFLHCCFTNLNAMSNVYYILNLMKQS
ncbi:unnamed protein product [Camellia sinensis]